MAMLKTDKIQLAEKLSGDLKGADALFLTSVKGLTYVQQDTVRRSIKASAGSDFKVVKNTLLKKALNACDINVLDDELKGSTAIAIIRGDVAAAAKEFKKFAKDYKMFEIKCGLLDGAKLSQADVIRLADLPSREELLAKMLGSMNAPVQNFVSLLANIPRSVLNVLNAIKDQKAE